MAASKQELLERARAQKEFTVRFLIRETGVTEAQARELIDIIGNNPNSLLREARFLRQG